MPSTSPGTLERQRSQPVETPQPPGAAGRRILYISYDGVPEPLGESQVVIYLERLASAYEVSLLSFEKSEDVRNAPRVARIRARLEASGIRWIPLGYHKRPPVVSTAFDVCRGLYLGLRWSSKGGARLAHARGYVPAVIALALRKITRVAFLFDMRGFWVDEKVEAGHWAKGGLLYRLGKWFERQFFQSTDGIVSLTEAGVHAFPAFGYRVRSDAPIRVIPTCVDLERFRPGPKDPARLSALGLAGHLVVGCVGTMSNWYLRRSMLDYLAFLSRRIDGSKVLIVTREDHERLKVDAEKSGLAPDRLALVRAEFDEMPELVRLIDVGVFFIKVCFSKRASAATKLGEFLASGVPVIINDGIGDSGRLVREHRVGVVLPDVTPETFPASVAPLVELLADRETSVRCRAVAVREFSIESGAAAYGQLYDRLLALRTRELSR